MELPSELLEQIAYNTRPKIEEHMLIIMDKSTHEEHLLQPLQTNNKQFKIAITFLSTYNGIFNVTNSNNKFYFFKSIYCELPKKTIRANGNIYHIFKPNIFLDVRNIYQDKASMDMTLDEFKYLTSTCWNEPFKPITIDMTKDKFTGRYRLGLNSIFVPNTSHF